MSGLSLVPNRAGHETSPASAPPLYKRIICAYSGQMRVLILKCMILKTSDTSLGMALVSDTGQEAMMGYVPIESCVAGTGMSSDVLQSCSSQPLYASCKCHGQCKSETCSCTIAYESDGRLKDTYLSSKLSPPLFECNLSCACELSCPNRVTQRQLLVDGLKVAPTDNKGHGVFTEKPILKGAFVGEYVGEVLTSTQAKERLDFLREDDPCYLLTYREHAPSGTVIATNIDASSKGNVMRFVNHSCSPNMAMVAVRVDSIVPKLCLFACRDIAPNEEICFSYFGHDSSTVATLGKKKCYCGAAKCVGYLPLEA